MTRGLFTSMAKTSSPGLGSVALRAVAFSHVSLLGGLMEMIMAFTHHCPVFLLATFRANLTICWTFARVYVGLSTLPTWMACSAWLFDSVH